MQSKAKVKLTKAIMMLKEYGLKRDKITIHIQMKKILVIGIMVISLVVTMIQMVSGLKKIKKIQILITILITGTTIILMNIITMEIMTQTETGLLATQKIITIINRTQKPNLTRSHKKKRKHIMRKQKYIMKNLSLI